MENLIVISFQNLRFAEEAINKLKELDEIGDIVIYNQVLMRKDSEGLFTILSHEGPDTMDLPVKGTLIGSLLGLAGGPMGLVLGALTGLLAGSVDKNYTEAFYTNILKKVKDHLWERSYALIVDVEEINTFLVDSYMVLIGDRIFRTGIDDVHDQYEKEQKEKFNEEIKAQEMVLRRATQEDKKSISENISNLNAERNERMARRKRRMENERKLLHQKIDNLRKKLESREAKRKSWLRTHKEKLEERLFKINIEASSVLL